MPNALRLLNETAKKLRTALGRLRDIERATSGLSAELEELDRDIAPIGVTCKVIAAGVRAVEIERERCAKIAEAYAERNCPDTGHTDGHSIAAEIRQPCA